MNKNNILVAVVVLGIVLVIGGFFIFNSFGPQEIPAPQGNDGIEVSMPKANAVLKSPLKITGKILGNGWTGFEGQVGVVKLFDSNDNQLALGILTATSDWMKLPTSFETTLFFDYPGDGLGKLVFYNENPSGEAERNRAFILPVKLAKSSSEKMKLKLYFSTPDTVNISCDTVLYTEREFSKSQGVARIALEALLLGPSDIEKQAGLFTNINPGVTLQSIVVKDGVAMADFSGQLDLGVAGSCNVLAIRAQIEETLKQFETVKSVVISINGKTEDILQP